MLSTNLGSSPSSQVLNLKHTTGRQAIDDPYHVQIIREKLMRAFSTVLPDVIDELGSAIPAYIPSKSNGQ